MDQTTLACALREKTGTATSRRLRRDNRVPCVVYGHKQDPVHLSVDGAEIEKLVHAGTRMVQLDVGGRREQALIKSVQHNAMGDAIVHVDFTRVAMDERIELAVPIETVGTAKGALAGGVLDLVHKELQVSCLPGNIPEEISVKVTDLQIGDRILVRDLPLPSDVTTSEDPGMTVVVVHPPTVVEVVSAEEEPEAGETAEPEVIGKSKEKEEGEEEAE